MVEFSRRKFLGAAGAAAATAAVAGTAACTGGTAGEQGGDYEMPTYQPAPELDVQPYHVTETPGMEDVYTEQVQSYFKSVDRGPGSGGSVTCFQLLWGDPPKSLDENPYWQELNERLGVSYEPQFVPQPVFDEKFSTMLASGDVPDLVFVNDQSAVNLQGIRDGAFADLSEVFSGDNILKWPNLAARKEEIWKASLKDGRIYQVPSIVWNLTNLPTMRTDLVEQTSIGPAPADADELFTMLAEVSALEQDSEGRKVYGLNRYDPSVALMFQRLFRTGPEWQLNDDGDLVHMTETENYRLMLEWLARAWDEGIFDPVSMSPTATDIISGAAIRYDAVWPAINAEGLAQWEKDLPGAKYDFFDMPGFDGSSQLVVRNIPYGKSTCVSAAAAEDEDRLTEILNVLDYFSDRTQSPSDMAAARPPPDRSRRREPEPSECVPSSRQSLRQGRPEADRRRRTALRGHRRESGAVGRRAVRPTRRGAPRPRRDRAGRARPRPGDPSPHRASAHASPLRPRPVPGPDRRRRRLRAGLHRTSRPHRRRGRRLLLDWRAPAAEPWAERLERIGLDRIRLASLSVNYRTPEEVMAAAEPVIRTALPDANVPTSVRSTGVPVEYGSTSDLDRILGSWLSESEEGTACVIGDAAYEGTDRVRSLPPEPAKGLEFDLVVLVDPDSFGGGVAGAVDRCVAMTRATRRLVVLTGAEGAR